MGEEENIKPGGPEGDAPPQNLDELIEQRERLDSLLSSQFTKELTVMFTDLQGSTTIAETLGDISTRVLLKYHNDIITSSLAENNGTLVKFIGDGTMSYFEKPEDALSAACAIQRKVDQYNMEKGHDKKGLIVIRAGIHFGKCIFEGKDLYGDTVNTAARIEGQAGGSEIYISQATLDKLDDDHDFYIRFAKEVTLKGKAESTKLHKVFWNDQEISIDMLEQERLAAAEAEGRGQEDKKPKTKIIVMAVLIPIILVILFIKISQYMNEMGSYEKKRSITHTAK